MFVLSHVGIWPSYNYDFDVKTDYNGGLHFVADSDIVIAAEESTFFDTHVKTGLVAGLEPVSLSRKIPLESVLRMSLIGGEERLNAHDAKNIGLISEIIESDNLMTRAGEIANKIKVHSPSALAKTKKAIWESQEMNLNDALKNIESINKKSIFIFKTLS